MIVRDTRLLRPLNALEGRDVIELEWRACDEYNDESYVNNDDDDDEVDGE